MHAFVVRARVLGFDTTKAPATIGIVAVVGIESLAGVVRRWRWGRNI